MLSDAPLRAGINFDRNYHHGPGRQCGLITEPLSQLDRENNQAFVYKLVNGAPVLQEVELGLRNERESQILAGLTDGDSVGIDYTH